MSNRDKIKESSLDLFIEKGYDGVSIKMILSTSGVSNGSLFHHFSTKEEIVQEIYTDIKAEIFAYLQEHVNPNQAIRKFMLNYWKEEITWGLQNPKKSKFIDMFNNTPLINNCLDEHVLKKYNFIVSRIMKAVIDEEIETPNITYFMYHFAFNTKAVVRYLTDFPDMPANNFVNDQFKHYWRSISN